MPPGRTPKPTATLKLHGTDRADRRHADEPMPAICIPKKPTFLKGAAAKEWKRITVELEKQGLLSEMDLMTLAGYCHAVGEVVKLDKKIASLEKHVKKHGSVETPDGKVEIEDGYLMYGAKGSVILNPLVKARKDAWEQVLKFGIQFGLSPVARTRISIGKADARNPWLAKMKQPAG